MNNKIRFAVAQLNFSVGDIAENTQKIIEASVRARDELKADVIIFPELALCGYPPEDLLLRNDFFDQIQSALTLIQQKTQGIDIVLGHPHRHAKKTYNSASVIRDQKIISDYHKQCLPNYGVFDEARYFSPGHQECLFAIKNISIGLIICEDIWHPQTMKQAKQAGAQLIICINASPFSIDKFQEREDIVKDRVIENKLPVIYVHGVGAQDDLVFDGGSFAMNNDGKICAHANVFKEELWSVDVETQPVNILSQTLPHPLSIEERVYSALVLSVRDYVNKNNFKGVLIGLSGGIDSALTLCIAVDALGLDRVHVAVLPSRYTSKLSHDLLQAQLKKLPVKTSEISIEPTYNALLNSLANDFKNLPPDITEENLQSRCRGIILMALSNKTGYMVLTTGNKSEMATGYATLYGDMVGGYAVLKDVSKTLVYRLANYRNTVSEVIPSGIITRPATAELKENQTDQDTLPPYEILDAILKLFIEEDKSISEIIAKGYEAKTVERVVALINRNEYKRRQSAPGPRITQRAFTRERRYPITSGFKSIQ
jgi:NAD+ synthase (glutamine-hydrolysing)